MKAAIDAWYSPSDAAVIKNFIFLYTNRRIAPRNKEKLVKGDVRQQLKKLWEEQQTQQISNAHIKRDRAISRF